MSIRFLLIAAIGLAAATASATDLQILCPEGAQVRLDGADAGVCREIEAGRYLRDVTAGEHVVEITFPGSAAQRYEIDLDPVVPGRLDAREAGIRETPTGSLFVKCIPERCTVRLNGIDLEIERDDLRLKEVPVGRYPLQLRRGKKTLEAVVFVKEGKPAGVRADFLGGRAGIISASEIPRLEDTRWGLAQTLEATLREKRMWEDLDAELRRTEALRKGQPVGEAPPPQ